MLRRDRMFANNTPSTIKRHKWILLCAIIGLAMMLQLAKRNEPKQLDQLGKSQAPCKASNEESLNWNGCFTSLNIAEARHTVDLSGNGFSISNPLPAEFRNWAKDKIHTLYLSDNLFETIPDLSSLHNVKMLSFRRNRLKTLDCDALPPNIYHLIITDNQISAFTGDCNSKLRNLNKLMMARNRLEQFPATLRLPQLELIRLPQNRIQVLPRTLLQSSPKLKWASFAQNPCCSEPPLNLEHVDSFRCEGEKELGSGTSGVALLCSQSRLVFKRFKPNSSDGSAEAELKISSLLPKDNPSILSPLFTASLAEEPSARGVVFPYKDAVAIGLPPQFGSDDVFPPNKQHRFSAKRVLDAVRQGTCGLAEMHRSGVVHMDLYAHNTLLSANDFVFLDFGAATCIKFLSAPDATLLKILDVRAFGVLIGNLLDYVVSDAAEDKATVAILTDMKRDAESGVRDAALLCTKYNKNM